MRKRNFLVASTCAVLLTAYFQVALAYEKVSGKAGGGDLLWISEEAKRAYLLDLGSADQEISETQIFAIPWNGHEVESRARHTLLNEDQKAVLDGGKKDPGKPHRDWKGIGRDTAFFLGYQGVFAGVLYSLPESVTSWTKEQKKVTVGKWGDNVRNPVWDRDKWWINYIGHPYFGATYYIRARERGFGEFGSFCYSALLSGMYEFGIEAFFEPPSYQDLIVTPAGGYLLGKFVFEPIREKIKAKLQLRWYDHLTLILTDPLGAINSVFEKLLGIKSDIRVQFRLPALSRSDPLSYDLAGFPQGQEVIHPRRQGAGLEFHMQWK